MFSVEIDEVLEGTITSVDQKESFSTRIYPNPATDQLFIENAEPRDAYSIFNLSGKQVDQGQVVNQSISLDLPAGVYILKIKGRDSQKFVIADF
jgi:hypothetical protein